MNSKAVSLDQALPDDVVANSSLGIFAYRNYPVFSLPWLKRRSYLFGIAIGLFASFVLIGDWLRSQNVHSAIQSAAYFFFAFMAMASAGPLLATWVRYRGFSLARERSWVVIAVVLGMLASYFADQWASTHLEQKMDTRASTIAAVGKSSSNNAINDESDVVIADLKKRAREPWVIAVNGIFLVMIYGALGGGLALRAYFSEQRRLTASQHQRELNAMLLQKEEAALRLGVLQAQVEPHFLFNTLASLRSLVRQDPALAETTIDALVDHLRATIPKFRGDSGKLFSTLGQQLDICASYLALMQVRMGRRLSFEINVPPHSREYEFPPLMLISLVENAIKHGLETKPGEGHVEIRAEKIITVTHDEKLQVSVLDNGPGFSTGLGGGLGLSNIREQLKVRFADAAKLSIATRPEGGTITSIEIPLLVKKENT